MYCIKCGVCLAESEKRCPLCGTVVFNPEVELPNAEKQYPNDKYPKNALRPNAWLFFATTVSFVALAIVFACDYNINNAVTWSGIVGGAFCTLYSALVLPFWFSKPNPAIFVPIFFLLTGGYLWYLNVTLGGNWFLTLAFPIVCFVGLVTTAMATLLHYLKKGRLYVYGGGIILFALLPLLIEFLLFVTFKMPVIWWSLFPLSVLFILGAGLIFLGICRPAKEALERKFFF